MTHTPAFDGRLGGFDPQYTAGTTNDLKLTWVDNGTPHTPVDPVIYIGGDPQSTTDTTGATAYPGVVAGNVSTHTIVIPAAGTHRFRIGMAGGIVAFGDLSASVLHREHPTSALTVDVGAVDVTVELGGVVINSGGPGGGAVDSVDGRTGAVTLGDLYDPAGAAVAAAGALDSTLATVAKTGAYADLSGKPAAVTDPLLESSPSWAVRVTEPEAVVSPFRGQTWRIPDLTGNGLHLEGGPGAIAPIRGGQWSGPVAVEQFTTPTNAGWVSEIDLTFTGFMLPRIYNPNEFNEVALSTVDHLDDYLEPAFVYQANGQTTVAMDWLTTEREQTWRYGDSNPGKAVPDPHAEHEYRITLDPSNARLEFWIDGALKETTQPASTSGNNSYTPATLPSTLAAPPVNHPLGVAYSGVAVRSFDLKASIGGASLYRFDAADGIDGDASVTTDGRTWTGTFGHLIDPTWATDEWKLCKGITGSGYNTATSPLGATIGDSTWACRIRPHEIDGTGGLWAGHNSEGMFTLGQPGWGFARIPGYGLQFGMIAGFGGGPPSVMFGASTKPTDEVVVAFTFEATGTTMFIDGVQVASGGSLHGLTIPGRPEPLMSGAGGLLTWAAAYDRVLTGPELLALNSL